MRAEQLIGKNAIRTTKTSRGDYSYTHGDSPLLIINATQHHVVYKHTGREAQLLDDKVRVLGESFADNNWTSWDELVNPKHREIESTIVVIKAGGWNRKV